MHIIADENILALDDYFKPLGNISKYPAHAISNDILKQADILLVRSQTKVNKTLLANTNIQFVGTATIGLDHIDTEYLQQNQITYAHAPGCNANAVSEYVISAIAYLTHKTQTKLKQKTVSIIGCGNTGTAVYRKLKALGIMCQVYDPPLSQHIENNTIPNTHQHPEHLNTIPFVPLEQALTADIITLHTPLTNETKNLLDTNKLNKIKENAWLINTSRGEVINESALENIINTKQLMTILDVWTNEPHINPSLKNKVTLATPHIAGYSELGKLNGTKQIYQALCTHLKKAPIHIEEPITNIETIEDESNIIKTLLKTYNPEQDAKAFAQTNDFAKARKAYSLRKEFSQYKIKSSTPELFQQLGYQVS